MLAVSGRSSQATQEEARTGRFPTRQQCASRPSVVGVEGQDALIVCGKKRIQPTLERLRLAKIAPVVNQHLTMLQGLGAA